MAVISRHSVTAEEFITFWTSAYPKTVVLSYYFKYDYVDRWFRIHSLPKSKRYAEDEEEWQLLLDRQNTIITDLLGNGEEFLLVTGDAEMEGYTELDPLSEVKSIQNFSFTFLTPIDLHKLSPEEYEEGHIYKPMFSQQIWQLNKFNDLLKDIANDEHRAFLVSTQNNCIVAPYDGGIDFIVKDQQTKEALKQKYSEWLSDRDDGL